MRHLFATLFFLLITFPLQADNHEPPEPGFNEATLKGLAWRSIGPAFMSGRISDIAIHPERQSTWYVAVGSGGVWKTENRGTTWTPIFDNEDSYSIGSLAIDPNNPDVIWVGTGENVSGRHVGYGSGLFRSRDGGMSWEKVRPRGLRAHRHDPHRSRGIRTRSSWPPRAPSGPAAVNAACSSPPMAVKAGGRSLAMAWATPPTTTPIPACRRCTWTRAIPTCCTPFPGNASGPWPYCWTAVRARASTNRSTVARPGAN